MPTNFEGPVTIDMPAGLDVAAAAGSSASASPSGGGGHPKLRLEMVSGTFASLAISVTVYFILLHVSWIPHLSAESRFTQPLIIPPHIVRSPMKKFKI